MAINLKKDNYDDNSNRFSGVSDDGEIYPRREVYPNKGCDDPWNNPENNIRDNPSQMNIQTEQETAVRVPPNNYAAVPPQNKHRKYGKILIIGAACILICNLIIIASLALPTNVATSYEEDTVLSEQYTEYSYSYIDPDTVYTHTAENVDSITVNADHIYLDIVYGSGSDAVFTVINSSEVSFSEDVSAEGENLLSINYISAIPAESYDYDSFYREDAVLTIPKDFAGQIRLTGKNSDISCSSAGSASIGSSIDFYCADGDISLYDVSADDIKLLADNGDIFATTVSAIDFTVSANNGGIYLSTLSVDNISDITAGNGYTELEDIYFGGETTITGNGYINGNNLSFYGDSSITCSNSDVTLNGITFKNMAITDSNGDIGIESQCNESDYTITAETTNGECDLISGGNGPYNLEVKNRNGNIYFIFDN